MSKELISHQKKAPFVAGLLAAGFIAFSACGPRHETINTPLPPTPIVEPALKHPEIALYYPSLSSFPIRESGQINTERSSTEWFNLSSANFDSNLASKAIDYFEKLASSKKNFVYEFSGNSIPLIPDVKPRTSRVIFLIPQQAPTPAWGQNVSWTASTTDIFKDGPYVSFVRVYDREQDTPQSKVFTTVDRAVNRALAVEICQSTILMGSRTVKMANLGQEIFCNSWGAAFTLKQYGLNYNQYVQWAKDTPIRANPQSPSYPLYVVTESDYQQIPKVGAIIKTIIKN